MHYLRKEVSYNIRRVTFWTAFFLIIFCFYFEHKDYFWDNIWKKSDVFYMFVVPFDYSLFFMMMPFAAVLPGALHIVDDFKSRNICLQCYRGSYRKLILCKLSACNISAALASFLACTVFLVFALSVAPLSGYAGEMWIQLSNGKSYSRLAHTAYGLPYIGEIILRTVLTAWLWSQIGCILSLLFQNKAITLIGTFILFYGLDFLFVFIGLHNWRPFLLFFSNLEYTGSILFRYLQNFIFIGISGVICFALMKIRLRQL